MNHLSLRPFTPSRENPATLAGRTVGRGLLLDSIERRLLTAATTKNRCHTLLVGPRGSGKTHVLDVALHRLRDDPQMNEGLIVARLDEDVVGIVTYADLVVHISEALGLPTDAAHRARASGDVVAIEAAITAHQRGRALIVVVENLSRVFASLGKSGQQDFRSFVETSGDVLLLASTSLLFRGVMSRSEPWFGSFAIEHLPELTLDEGTELLRRLAVEDGDEQFARYITEPRGQGRLAALHHLAGGSPRLWMVLAGRASVELLDELVPAVEELLEKLVAYYQQRLWELPGNEQKLVRELGTGPPSATVGDLAERCGLEERTAASALGRLAEAGWVRSEKLPGTDRRKSWYRLREPLLRHHFQYRQADGEPLRLIVDILRLWFDPSERRIHLAAVRPTSVAERHLLANLSLDPPQRSDAAYAEAIAGFSTVVDDMVRVLGPANQNTRIAERNQIRLLVGIDRRDEATRLAVATVDRLAGSVGDADAATREAAEALLEILVELLQRGKQIPAIGATTSRPAGEILDLMGQMEAARDGSAEAGARLPAALRSLVDGLQRDPHGLAGRQVRDRVVEHLRTAPQTGAPPG